MRLRYTAVLAFGVVVFSAAWGATAQFRRDLGTVVHPELTLDAKEQVRAVAFAPDARSLAVGSGMALQLWDTAGGARPLVTTLNSVDRHSEAITDVAYRPDGRFVATAARDGRMKLWDPQTGRLAAESDRGSGVAIRNLRFAPDSETLAASVAGVIWTFDGTSLKKKAEVPIPGEMAMPIQYTLDGSTLVTLSDRGTVRFFDASSRRETRRWSVASNANASITRAASTDDASLVACASMQKVTLHDGVSGRIRATILVPDEIADMVLSPDGVLLAIAARDHAIRAYDTETGRITSTLVGDADGPFGIAFSADSVLLASGSASQVFVWAVPR